ncbi:MAG: alkaline phosphatase family protein [Candidatus Bathyarchaeia archaeon]|jgi:predicted AlkP superfamily pyrophosphatase or phosphodiesterase
MTGASKSVTVAILIDAFRYDMLGKDTPFLSKMAEKGVTGRLVPPLGYCLHPTWFAGLYPEKSDKFLLHIYSPQTSPYKRMKLLSFLERRNKLTRVLGGFLGNHVFHLPGFASYIPQSSLKNFDIAEKLPPWDPQFLPEVETLFDIFEKNNVRWLFIGSPGSDQRTDRIVAKFQKEVVKKPAFVWLHFAEVDWFCHSFGPSSLQSKHALTGVDIAVEKIFSHLLQVYDEVNMVVFGDHGHVPVSYTVDIEKILRKTSLRLNDDYVYFLDSTIARFWVKNEQVQNELERILSDLTSGHLLSTQYLKEQNCNFTNLSHGQIFWAVNEGYVILPNFWQGGAEVRGMHGYLPDVKDNHSRFVISGPKVRKIGTVAKNCALVDLFPTFLDLMNLPIPSSSAGTSILRYGVM